MNLTAALFTLAALLSPPLWLDDDGVVDPRPLPWAQPLTDVAGLPNSFRVADSFLRGAQPDPEGFAQLRRLGVKTVLNLRTFHSDRALCAAAGLDYVKVSVQAWETERAEILDVLEVLTDSSRQPVFLHCQHGADRTGVMTALYRMVVQGWPREEAIAEMTTGGFGFHSIWTNLVSSLEEMEISELRAALGRRQQRARSSATRSAIHTAWTEHIAAARSKDLDGVMEIYASDMVYMVGDANLHGRAALRLHEQEGLASSTVLNALHATDSLKVFEHSAFELGTIVGPVASGDEPARTVEFSFMARWHRDESGRWRLSTLVGQL